MLIILRQIIISTQTRNFINSKDEILERKFEALDVCQLNLKQYIKIEIFYSHFIYNPFVLQECL